jgi:hypothetical protein
MPKSPHKGEVGYRLARRGRLLIYVGVGAAAILALLALRGLVGAVFATGPADAVGGAGALGAAGAAGALGPAGAQSIKNVLTVAAILAVLPTANLAAPLLASWPYGNLDAGVLRLFAPLEDRLCVLYELIVTSKEQILPLDVCVVHPSGVYAYCPKAGVDGAKAKAFIHKIFVKNRLDMQIMLYSDAAKLAAEAAGLVGADETDSFQAVCTEENVQPAAGGTQPVADETQPVADDTQPAAGGMLPTADKVQQVSDMVRQAADLLKAISM